MESLDITVILNVLLLTGTLPGSRDGPPIQRIEVFCVLSARVCDVFLPGNCLSLLVIATGDVSRRRGIESYSP